MIFGRPTLLWDDERTVEEYYQDLGYGEVHTLDVSDYQGANIIHDLNDANLPEHLIGQYDAVSFGGTAEHVFNVGNVLCTAAKLLKIGGTVDCSAPVNNWIDHGFYQISPTLKFDFFYQNGFELGESRATICMPGQNPMRRFVPVYPGEAQSLNFVGARILHALEATKLAASTCDLAPLQSVYLKKHDGKTPLWRFRASEPFDLLDGERLSPPMRRFNMPNHEVTARSGSYAFPFRNELFPPSLPGRPFKSKALVYEDGRLLDWIVGSVAMVAERPGSFGHFGAYIHFTASDGSDPRSNGRAYQVAFPHKFDGLSPYPGGAEAKFGASPARSFVSSVPRENLRSIQQGTMRFSWRGTMCNKNPFDFALYPMLIWEQKPATIIEIGSKFGGSALWLDDLCIRFGLQTKILCIDVDIQRIKVNRKNISIHEGDGRDLGATLTDEVVAGLPHPWLVIEDADHHYLTTKAVMDFMAKRMVAGDYLIIEDGISVSFGTDSRPEFDGGPSRAVGEFTSAQPGVFELETRFCDFFGYNVTWNPNGYLRKTDKAAR